MAVTSKPGPDEAPVEYVQPQWVLPAGATQVVLVRHGASAHAVAGRPFPLLDGHGDPPLSDLGLAQAERVAERLRGTDVAALFVTTLVRTSQTAEPLAALLGLEPVVVPELREVLLGEWEGGLFRIKVREGDPLAVRMMDEERWDVIPGAESMEAFAKRVADGLRIVAEAVGPDATGVAFVHAGVIAEACRQAADSRSFAFVGAENGSLTRLVVNPDGRLTLRSYNETGHL